MLRVCRVWALGFRVCRVWALGFIVFWVCRVWTLGFIVLRVFRVHRAYRLWRQHYLENMGICTI